MKIALPVILLLILVGIVMTALRKADDPKGTQTVATADAATRVADANDGQSRPKSTPSTPLVQRPSAMAVNREAPAATAPASGEVRRELDDVSFGIRDFRTALGENPIGNNAEITKALLGNNLKQVKLPIPSGSSVNGQGELCDRWGTPYFFHQLSGKEMEIRSAGADHEMWTKDDIVVK